MNQKKIINLIDYTDKKDHPFGNRQGKKTFAELVNYIDENPTIKIFGISLKGIVATDASFPRESVISVAKHYRGEKGFYLLDFNDRDLIDNWDYAAKAKDQPLAVLNDNEFEYIGPPVKSAVHKMLTYIQKREKVTTSQLAHDFQVSVQNASAKLKKFAMQGFVIRTEETSESGGIEYVYESIH